MQVGDSLTSQLQAGSAVPYSYDCNFIFKNNTLQEQIGSNIIYNTCKSGSFQLEE